MIAFVGSVFSPYYARARRRGVANPDNHLALNVALYGADRRRWAMTERGAAAGYRTATEFALGPSSLRWRGDALEFLLDEISVPIPRRVRGRVRLLPHVLLNTVANLDAAGRHRWRPLAPAARIEVSLSEPALRWSGEAYFDSNEGDVPLEADVRSWQWSRAAGPDATSVLYDIDRHDGKHTTLALRFNARGEVQPLVAPAPAELPPSRIWRITRTTRSEDGSASVRSSLEDTPFYARSLINQRLEGRVITAVHESLNLQRFAHPLVQAMLAFRMPRRAR